jgi:hypothetical protein
MNKRSADFLWFRMDEDLKSLQGDPRFAAMLAQAKKDCGGSAGAKLVVRRTFVGTKAKQK